MLAEGRQVESARCVRAPGRGEGETATQSHARGAACWPPRRCSHRLCRYHVADGELRKGAPAHAPWCGREPRGALCPGGDARRVRRTEAGRGCLELRSVWRPSRAPEPPQCGARRRTRGGRQGLRGQHRDGARARCSAHTVGLPHRLAVPVSPSATFSHLAAQGRWHLGGESKSQRGLKRFAYSVVCNGLPKQFYLSSLAMVCRQQEHAFLTWVN